MQIKRVAILFSGNGSNLEALIKALHNKCFCATNVDFIQQKDFFIGGIPMQFKECNGGDNCFKIEVTLALSNKKDAYGLTRAKNLGIPTCVIESAGKSREVFDTEVVKTLESLELDLCILAGFMRILTPIFTQKIHAINIHPSLLPLFKGAHGIEDSYNSAMQVGGVSVHYVSDELDSGELIAQGVIVKQESETLESYAQKIHALEHFLYPLAVLKVLNCRILS